MDGFRSQVWENMLTAEMNALYWSAMTRRYVKRDQTLKIFLASMTSGTVAGWGFWSEISAIWQLLSCSSALLAIAMPTLNLEHKIAKMSEMTGKWSEVRFEAESIWLKLEGEDELGEIKAKFYALRGKLTSINKDEARLPVDKYLLSRCQQQVCVSRKLQAM